MIRAYFLYQLSGEMFNTFHDNHFFTAGKFCAVCKFKLIGNTMDKHRPHGLLFRLTAAWAG